MSDTRHTRLLIIGSGPAGYTAAVYGARAMLKPILIQGIQPGGQLTITTEVENWPGDVGGAGAGADGAHGGARAGRPAPRSSPTTSPGWSSDKRPFTAIGDGGTVYTADAVILATGAQAKWLGLPSEERFKGFGVSACATCDGFFYRGREVVVIGGGNTAVEEALFLTNFATKVTLVHRRDELRAEKILQERLFKHPKIEVIWHHALDEVLGEKDPRGVTGVRLRDLRTGAERVVPCDGVFIAIGHAPASQLVEGQLETHHGGYVVTQARLDRHLDPRRLRGRRHRRPDLPPGGHLGRHGLHGRARRRALPRRGGRGEGGAGGSGAAEGSRWPHA